MKKRIPQKAQVGGLKARPPIKSGSKKKNRGWPLLVIIALSLFMISLFCYLPASKNDFINSWDDNLYVVTNSSLHNFSGKNIKEIFTINTSLNTLINNYHPLTMLSLTLDYQVSQLTPSTYILTNSIIHAINAVLAFLFVYLLSGRKIWAAILTGLWLGIHPMHVESVAWISERKDVLYSFFFLGGLILYIQYLQDNKMWKLGLCFVFFCCSVLSKAMAIPFPFVLLLIDYFRRRPFSVKLILEKIPFLFIAVIFGLISLHLQSKGAINDFRVFTLMQRTMHASYGFITYIMKFISPNPLSAFYPYPAITEHGQLPIIFRLAPYVFLVLMIITAWFITRRGQMGRVWVFGILFYVVMLLMVIQFISVGKAIIADRYTYIPYIGLTFIIGMWLDYLLSKKQAFRIGGIVLAGILFLFSLFFIYTTVERTRVWKNDITLWTDALGKYPDVRMNFIYERRGNTFLQNKQYDLALNDYMTILKNDSLDENAYASVGSIYGRFLNQPDKALPYLERGYKINPKNPFILKSLGVVHGMQGQIPKALEYFLQAYKLDPDDPILLQNIAGSYINIGEKLKSEEFKAKAEALGKKKVNSEQ